MQRFVLFSVLLIGTVNADIGFNIVEPKGFHLIKSGKFGGALWQMQPGNGAVYDELPYVLNLTGSHYNMGYDAGSLFGNAFLHTFSSLLTELLGNSTLLPIEEFAVEAFADWQWNSYLSKQVPPEYLEELKGLDDGGSSIGLKDVGKYVARGAVLANLPGTLSDIIYVLADEFSHSSVGMSIAQQHNIDVKRLLHKVFANNWRPMQCSMMGAWGPRTQQGRLFTFRNLDWDENTGINKFKMIAVFHPDKGTAHATAGFAGIMGALTGMSAKGITVHEANLEEKPETFRGFPWIYRLRYIMQSAHDLETAKTIWENTNNTVGFNHMVGSAHDGKSMVMETAAFYTAYFMDDDPREANAMYFDKHLNHSVKVGYPLKNAVWRTNHGYDPFIMKNYLWSQGPTSDTEIRYMLIHNALVDYESRQVLMGPEEAVNVTALVGQKGDDYFHCGNTHKGSNILSVTFDPSNLVMYVAWEAFGGNDWRPAACNSYVKFDMTKWF